MCRFSKNSGARPYRKGPETPAKQDATWHWKAWLVTFCRYRFSMQTESLSSSKVPNSDAAQSW